MKRNQYLAIVCAGLVGSLSAQEDVKSLRGLPFLRAADSQVLDQQAASLFQTLKPLAEATGSHAVNIEFNHELVVRGTITSAGIVTKWSEIKALYNGLTVVGADAIRRPARLKAVYTDYDLALLESDHKLPAVKFPEAAETKLGTFLFSVTPAKEALGMGVVSVLPRSLREKDKAFLGVRMDFRPVQGGGVQLLGVEPDSSAAHAGLIAGDVVKKINGKELNGLLEMGNFLQRLKPGEKASLTYLRQGQLFTTEAILGARPEYQRIPPARMRRMNQMGGGTNEVSDGFPNVLQSDMQVQVTEVGSPVFDLDGKFVGVILARASRIKTYIIPANALEELLKQKPDYLANNTAQPASSDVLEEQNRQEEIQRLKSVIEHAERRLQELER